MRIKILVALVVATAGFGVGYFVGFTRGGNAFARERDMFDLRVYPHLMRLFQTGDTNTLESSIRSLIATRGYHYDEHFGSETVTDEHFLRGLEEARAMFAQDRTNQVVNK